jgi:hypothetical protein
MSRPDKIECEGCAREVLTRNAADWLTITATAAVPSYLTPAPDAASLQFTGPAGHLVDLTPQPVPPRVASGDSCSPKCDVKVLKALREALAEPSTGGTPAEP